MSLSLCDDVFISTPSMHSNQCHTSSCCNIHKFHHVGCSAWLHVYLQNYNNGSYCFRLLYKCLAINWLLRVFPPTVSNVCLVHIYLHYISVLALILIYTTKFCNEIISLQCFDEIWRNLHGLESITLVYPCCVFSTLRDCLHLYIPVLVTVIIILLLALPLLFTANTVTKYILFSLGSVRVK